jgi:polar amino acid transport system ATP-binding protein
VTPPPARRALALRAEGLSKRYGATTVLDGVSLDVPVGDVVVLVGPSGCGKSTFLRCLTWLDPPDAGLVEVGGRPFGRERTATGAVRAQSRREIDLMRPRLGLVFQQLNLWPHWSVRDNVERPQRIVLGRAPEEARAKADALLARLRIGDLAAAFPAQLSGGQRQRVAIARSLAMNPAVMLFDEPTSALDPELVGEVLGTIRELAAGGTTMIVVTHEIGFARSVADRLVFMDQGRIVRDGAPADVLDDPGHPRARAFFDKILARRPGDPARGDRA